MSKDRKIFIIIAFIAAIAFIAVDIFMPEPISETFEFLGDTGVSTSINIDSEIPFEFASEATKIGKKDFGVYGALIKNEGDRDNFVLSSYERHGILNNKYTLWTTTTMLQNELVLNQYEHLSCHADCEVKDGSKYIGSVYYGVVPANCVSVKINGAEAQIQKMNFEMDGEQIEFNVYYLLKEEASSDFVPIICTDSNGDSYLIEAVENANNSVIKIN